jgi:hypothetical protein
MSSTTSTPQPPAPDPEKKPIDAYYDPAKRGWLVQDNDGNWINVDTSAMKTRLAQAGFKTRREETQMVSPADAVLVEIQQKRSVAYVGPLAGFKRGCYSISGYKVLVTHSPRCMEGVKGEWPLLRQVIENQFRDPDSPDQALYYYAWLRAAVNALYTENRKYGQALVLAGPKGCGKSLLQGIITELLGGRSAKPFRYMMGGTNFNRELFGAEHQMIEDEAASTDPRVRMRFGSAIKMVTATHEHSCHGKGREAVMLTPFWRLTISVNDEPQNLMILPPMEDSLTDKLIVLRSVKHPMPMPTETPEQEAAFWKALTAELPAFVHWLRFEFEVPVHIRGERYGVRPYMNPHIAAAIDSLSPHTRLLNLIDQVFWQAPLGETPEPFWRGTAEEAENRLHTSNFKAEAGRLLTWAYAMGAYLGELAKHRPDRVENARTSTSRDWIIWRLPKATPAPDPAKSADDVVTDTLSGPDPESEAA